MLGGKRPMIGSHSGGLPSWAGIGKNNPQEKLFARIKGTQSGKADPSGRTTDTRGLASHATVHTRHKPEGPGPGRVLRRDTVIERTMRSKKTAVTRGCLTVHVIITVRAGDNTAQWEKMEKHTNALSIAGTFLRLILIILRSVRILKLVCFIFWTAWLEASHKSCSVSHSVTAVVIVTNKWLSVSGKLLSDNSTRSKK